MGTRQIFSDFAVSVLASTEEPEKDWWGETEIRSEFQFNPGLQPSQSTHAKMNELSRYKKKKVTA